MFSYEIICYHLLVEQTTNGRSNVTIWKTHGSEKQSDCNQKQQGEQKQEKTRQINVVKQKTSKTSTKSAPIQVITTVKKQQIQQVVAPKKKKSKSVRLPTTTYKQTTPIPVPYYTVHPLEELWMTLPRKK